MGCSEWRPLGKRGTTGRAGRMAEMALPCSEPRNLVLRETRDDREGTPLARDIEAYILSIINIVAPPVLHYLVCFFFPSFCLFEGTRRLVE